MGDSAAGSTGELAGYSAGSTGGLLRWDTRRDPLASRCGRILGGGIQWRAAVASRSSEILGRIHWRAALAGYSAGSTGEPLWRDTRRDLLASSSGGDTRRDPLASCSGGILGGIHWRAALAGYSAGSTGWRAALAGYSAGSTGEQLWRDTRRDPLASCSGGILGGGVVQKHRKHGFQHKIYNSPFLSGGDKNNLLPGAGTHFHDHQLRLRRQLPLPRLEAAPLLPDDPR